ncbi:hypothetical protein K0M31_018350, partial [Melipona bicolor]
FEAHQKEFQKSDDDQRFEAACEVLDPISRYLFAARGRKRNSRPTLLQLAGPWILDVHPLILRAKRCNASHTGGGSGAVDDGNPSWFSWMPAELLMS